AIFSCHQPKNVFPGQRRTHGNQYAAQQKRAESFYSLVSVWVIGVWLFARQAHNRQYNPIRGNVGKRVDTIDQQRLGVKKSASNDFYNAQEGVQEHADKGDTGGCLFLLVQIWLGTVVLCRWLFHVAMLRAFCCRGSITSTGMQ